VAADYNVMMLPFAVHPLAFVLGPLDFAEPIWLLLLLLLIPIVYLWKTSRVPASKFRRGVSLLLRSSLILAIVLSLAGTRLVWFNHGLCVVFVIDQSQSVPGPVREVVRDALARQIDKMQRDDLFSIVEFGGDSVLSSLPSPKGPVPQPTKVLDTGHTDIARALRLAMATFPPDRQKRVVLFSDGNQNVGDALRESRIAAINDVDVDVLLLAAKAGHELMVEQVVTPPRVQKDANFVVRAIISSDIEQDAKLQLMRDGSAMGQQMPVHLKPGSNVLDIPDSLSEGNFHEYSVTVSPKINENDTFSANNTGYGFTQVDAPGKVLLVRGKSTSNDYLTTALQRPPANLTVETVGPTGLPAAVKDYAPYDCVIIDNVSVAYMSESQMSAVRDWVKNQGGGLVLIGGNDSFGPGGWKDKPIEEVSPVYMDIKRKKHLASLAIVVVLDKSGSMGAPAKGGTLLEKMDLANQGAVEVIKALTEVDEAMIGAVDTEVKWMGDARVVPMTGANKAHLISNTLANRAGGGGIYCKTALAHAYKLLNSPNVNAMAKHVIMFADAQDSEQPEDCVAMAKSMFEKYQITTSVIGMGTKSDPDVPFQQEVAGPKAGHGRWEITDDVMALPRMFAKEAFIVSRSAYVEKPEGITPTLYQSPLLEGFLGAKSTGDQGSTGGVPRLYGYVGATLKPRATLAMHGLEADDPVLSHWSIGLGKCVAFTSDDNAHWGKDWVAWDGYAKFWAQVVRWVGKTAQSNNISTTTAIEGSEGRVIVEALDDSGKPLNNLDLKANVSPPNLNTNLPEVRLEQVAPGRYVGRFNATSTGTYLTSVFDAGSNSEIARGGGVLSYPPEYRDLVPNAALLRNLAESSGGQFLTDIDAVFQHKPQAVRTFWPLWQLLLVFVASALFLDIAWRRLNIADWFRRTTSTAYPTSAIAGQSLGAFRSIKSGRSDVQKQRETLRQRIETRAQTAPPIPPTATAVLTDSANSAAPTSTPSDATNPTATPPQPPAAEGYANRLMVAKKRAAQQIKDQSTDGRN